MLKVQNLWKSLDVRLLRQPFSSIAYQQFVMQLSGLVEKTDRALAEEWSQDACEQVVTTFFQHLLGAERVGWRAPIAHRHGEVALYQGKHLAALVLVVPPWDRKRMISRRAYQQAVFVHMLLRLLWLGIQENRRPLHLIITNLQEWYAFEGATLTTALQAPLAEDEPSLWEQVLACREEPEVWPSLIRDWQKQPPSLGCTFISLFGLQQPLQESLEAPQEKLLGLLAWFSPSQLLGIPPVNERQAVHARFERQLQELMGGPWKNETPSSPDKGLYALFWAAHQRRAPDQEPTQWQEAARRDCLATLCRLMMWKVRLACRQSGENRGHISFQELLEGLKTLPDLLYVPVIGLEELSEEGSLHLSSWLDSPSDHRLQQGLPAWLAHWPVVLGHGLWVATHPDYLYLEDLLASLDRLAQGMGDHAYMPARLAEELSERGLVRAICQRFNEQFGWEVDGLEALKKAIDPLSPKVANACMDQVRLCDPAMGTGTLLLQSWKRWLHLKVQLGVLCDDEGEGIFGFQSRWLDGQWLLFGKDGRVQGPWPEEEEALRLRKALFQEAQHLLLRASLGLEPCVEAAVVAQARMYLWLLPWAVEQLEDLHPLGGMFHNLRQANGLVSRFPVDAEIRDALRATPYGFEDYKYVIELMKIARSSREILEAQQMLRQFKQLFRSHVSSNDRRKKRLERLERTFYQEFQSPTLLDLMRLDTEKEAKKQALLEEIARLKRELEEEGMGAWYTQAYEWRLEFPEVLDAEGRFTGFDLVFCCPPSIRQEKLGGLRHYFKRSYRSYHYQANLYQYYLELSLGLLRPQGQCLAVIPEAWERVQYTQALRRWLRQFHLQEREALEPHGMARRELLLLERPVEQGPLL